MPIYLVKTPNGQKMVNAPTKARAINHVIKNTITAEALSAETVVARMEDGEAVEKVGYASEAPVQPEATEETGFYSNEELDAAHDEVDHTRPLED